MKFNFDKEKGSNKNKRVSIEGGYEEMVKERKKRMGELEDNIREAFDNYDGGTFAIVRVLEDENGDPESLHTVIGGVADIKSMVKLAEGLEKASDAMKQHVVESVTENPESLGGMLAQMLTEIKKGMK